MALAYDGAIQRLIDAFGHLPGIGPKGAQRIAFYMLSPPKMRPASWPRPSKRSRPRFGSVRFVATCARRALARCARTRAATAA